LVSDEGPLTWGFGEQPIRLLLGVEDTDNVALGWVCEARRVVLISPYDDPGTVLRLRSGGAERSYRLGAPQEAGAEGGEAATSLNDPIFQSFLKTGDLRKGEGGRWSSLNARGAERAEADRFDRACRAEQTLRPGAPTR
jgi:hypothetical protein